MLTNMLVCDRARFDCACGICKVPAGLRYMARLTLGVSQYFLLSCHRKSVPELDGKLRLGSMPFLGRPFPLCHDVFQRQVDELGGRLILTTC